MRIVEKELLKNVFVFDKFDENILIWSNFEELKILFNWFDLIGNIDFFWSCFKGCWKCLSNISLWTNFVFDPWEKKHLIKNLQDVRW